MHNYTSIWSAVDFLITHKACWIYHEILDYEHTQKPQESLTLYFELLFCRISKQCYPNKMKEISWMVEERSSKREYSRWSHITMLSKSRSPMGNVIKRLDEVVYISVKHLANVIRWLTDWLAGWYRLTDSLTHWSTHHAYSLTDSILLLL